MTITSVSCPSDVPKKKAGTFDCTAQIKGGGTATVVVTQVNGINKYSYTFNSGALKVSDDAVERVVQQRLEQEGVKVTAGQHDHREDQQPGDMHRDDELGLLDGISPTLVDVR